MDARTGAIDLAKEIFEVAVANRVGRVVNRMRLTRWLCERFAVVGARRPVVAGSDTFVSCGAPATGRTLSAASERVPSANAKTRTWIPVGVS